MRYVFTLILGLVVGGIGAIVILFYNPATSKATLSPLVVSSQQQINLNYSVVADDAILYTNDGESRVRPFPDKVSELWEPAVAQTAARVTVLKDSRGRSVGIGIKYSSRSESTRLLSGKALVDSVWHIYLPKQGTMLLSQTENYWGFLREIVLPAHWNSKDSWKGRWLGTMTSGPGALGTARVYGGSGVFEGVQAEAVEAFSAKAYSAQVGPVAIDGQILIEVAPANDALAADAGAE